MLEGFVKTLERWSVAEPGLKAVALVGSHARSEARPDSDIDIVIICADPNRYLESANWLSVFGKVKDAQREDWGLVQTWRVFYLDGPEVEYNITTEQWCSDHEIDSGTGRVIRDGVRILFDPHSLFANLIVAVKNWKPSQQ
jgi:hypothetical protein